MSADHHKDDCGKQCDDQQALLCELLDEDTTQERATEIQEIIASCPECFGRLKSEQEVRAMVRRCGQPDPAPEQLRTRIMQRISITYTETHWS
ncbi:mycothiol system anti-sigma-R factor [Corynebacterium lubricantis]|uniref:mycothiol system anti-sigma-R factor n=1 Tax=Corynebacterium lubricantis TaxID=541095 RepID=UPI0003625B22|nr:mycothiol system anti-sigma-R factor [Corynebacterium lubricantis]